MLLHLRILVIHVRQQLLGNTVWKLKVYAHAHAPLTLVFNLSRPNPDTESLIMSVEEPLTLIAFLKSVRLQFLVLIIHSVYVDSLLFCLHAQIVHSGQLIYHGQSFLVYPAAHLPRPRCAWSFLIVMLLLLIL